MTIFYLAAVRLQFNESYSAVYCTTLSIHRSITTLLMAFSLKIHTKRAQEHFALVKLEQFYQFFFTLSLFLPFLLFSSWWFDNSDKNFCVQTKVERHKGMQSDKKKKVQLKMKRIVCKGILRSCNYIICFISYTSGRMLVFV